MITTEQLSANPALSALTDEQRTAIAEMSRNDEATVIGQRTSEIYQGLDRDIESSTGIKRNGDEKTFDYLKRTAGILKARADKAAGMEENLTRAQDEITRLKEHVKNGGGDTEVVGKLQKAESEYNKLKKDYDDLKGSIGDLTAQHAAELHGMRVETEIQGARTQAEFKSEIPQSLIGIMERDALAKIKGYKAEMIDDGKGGKRLAYRNEDGTLMNNPENNLAPYTTAELYFKEMADVLKGKREAKGGGATPPAGNAGKDTPADVSGVKTQKEAMDVITKSLLAKGLVKGSEDFQEELSKAWADGKVSELPEK